MKKTGREDIAELASIAKTVASVTLVGFHLETVSNPQMPDTGISKLWTGKLICRFLAILVVALVSGCQQPHSSGISRNDVDLAARAAPLGAAGIQLDEEYEGEVAAEYEPAAEHKPTDEYKQAVELARNAGPEAISRELLALTPRQDGTWTTIDGKPHVLMATWTNYYGYSDPGERYENKKYEIWVTAVPELEKFARNYRPGNREPTEQELTDRLEQLLGLPHIADYALVVEMWVSPDRLFRPSADPEITDHEGQLYFPNVVAPGSTDIVVPYLTVSEPYRTWYRDQEQKRYQPDNGLAYPWTRLGYTFDWNDLSNPVGLSEFVVMSFSTVTIESKTPTAQYGRDSEDQESDSQSIAAAEAFIDAEINAKSYSE